MTARADEAAVGEAGFSWGSEAGAANEPEGPEPRGTEQQTSPQQVAPGMRGEDVKPAQFSPLPGSSRRFGAGNIDLLMDVTLPLAVELGRTTMRIKDIVELGPGSIIELDRAAGEPVDLVVNGKLIARGEVVVIDENFGIRIVEIVPSVDKKLGAGQESDARGR